jgi:hypothetical protein
MCKKVAVVTNYHANPEELCQPTVWAEVYWRGKPFEGRIHLMQTLSGIKQAVFFAEKIHEKMEFNENEKDLERYWLNTMKSYNDITQNVVDLFEDIDKGF